MKTGRMKFFKHNIFNESHKTILEKLIQNSNLKCFLFHAKFIFKTPLIIVKISNTVFVPFTCISDIQNY